MKKGQSLILVLVVFTLVGCKGSSGGQGTSPEAIATAPLIDGTTQQANADAAQAAAGWADLELTTLNATNGINAMDQTMITADNLQSSVKTNHGFNIQALAARQALQRVQYLTQAPARSTTTTNDGTWTTTTNNQNFNGTINCNYGGNSIVGGSGTSILKYVEDGSQQGHGLSLNLSFDHSACQDKEGNQVHGAGKMTWESEDLKRTNGETIHTTGSARSKLTAGLAFLNATGEKYKLLYDEDMVMSMDVTYDQAQGTYTGLVTLTYYAKINDLICTIQAGYGYEEILQNTADLKSSLNCN